ncbi:MAG: hypothetical protein LBK99_11770 [Opitutaceae bacterium]|jgi:hypothetical protein|nr:hypothetical protein [Opitutaceae bacterium]
MKTKLYNSLFVSIALASTAAAQNLILNGSFEEGVLSKDTYSLNKTDFANTDNSTDWLKFWNVSDDYTDGKFTHRNATTGSSLATDGNQILAFTGSMSDSTRPSLWQEVSLQAGVTYQLSFDVVRIANDSVVATYYVGLKANTDIISNSEYAIITSQYTWGTFSQTFTAQTTEDYIFSIARGANSANNSIFWIDNVSLTTMPSSVPEPAIYAISLGASVFILVSWRKKRHR